MNFRKIYEEYIIRISATLFFNAALMLFMNERLSLGVNNFFLTLSALFFSAAASIFDFFGKKPVLYIATGAVIAITAVIFRIFSISAISAALNSFKWFFGSRDSGDENALGYALISSAVLSLIGAVIIFNAMRFKFARYFFGAAALTAVIIAAMIEISASPLMVFSAFSFILLFFYELFIRDRLSLTYLLPLILVTGIMISILPSKPEPIRWEAVKDAAVAIGNAITRAAGRVSSLFSGDSGEFGISMIGYSDSGFLGSGLRSSSKDALEVRNRTAMQSLYLTGSVMDTYNGKGWSRTQGSDNSEYREYILDLLEFALSLEAGGVLSPDMEDMYNILAVRNIDIKHTGIRTKTMFYPMKPIRTDLYAKADYSGAGWVFANYQDEGAEYELRYIEINYQNETVLNILRSEPEYPDIDIRELQGKLRNLFDSLPGAFLEVSDDYADILERRKESIYDVYAALPDSVPERVYDLAEEITEGCSGTYEKMKAIENYLSGFKYTLTPQEMSGEDFSDWFLFEAKEGYCTYFATAAAVLGRTLGIPVRYVQGFAAHPSGEEITVIKNDNAHAWAEAYIDGAGWIPFEASPSYSDMRYGEWKNKKPVGSGNYVTPYIPNYDQIPAFPEIEPVEADIQKEKDDLYATVFITAFAVIASAAAVLILGILLPISGSKKKYKKLDDKKRFMINFEAVMFLLELHGMPIAGGETLRAFSDSVGDNEFGAIVSAHETLVYKNGGVTEEDVDASLIYKEKLYKSLKSRSDKIRYVFYLFKGIR